MSEVNFEKIAVVIRDDLPLGAAVNVAACLTAGITAKHPTLAGQALKDRLGLKSMASSHVPIVALKGNDTVFQRLLTELTAQETANNLCIFPDYAKSIHTAEEYWQRHAHTVHDGTQILGLALIGDKKWLNKYTGNLPLLR